MEGRDEDLGRRAARQIRDFLATHDRNDPMDRWVVARIRERAQAELYRREREHFPEWIDVGGEA